jgi:LmbE family N-acetylglucosaminyl deacetylase
MDFSSLTPQIVLGIVAHPDDLDFGAGGTMAHFARQGAEVYYLILTDGCNGTTDRTMTGDKLVKQRCTEQRNACDILGVKDVFFCKYPDGNLENTRDVRHDIVKAIRQVKPDVVITWDPSVLYSAKWQFINHPDHRAAGQAALDAVFPLARDHMSFPDLLKQGYEPHKTATVLLMNFNTQNYYVDISDLLDLKIRARAAHTTQLEGDNDVQSLLTEFAEEAGKACGARYAEGFVRVDIHNM